MNSILRLGIILFLLEKGEQWRNFYIVKCVCIKIVDMTFLLIWIYKKISLAEENFFLGPYLFIKQKINKKNFWNKKKISTEKLKH